MDNKNYLKSCPAAMHLAIIKKQRDIPADRLSFPSALEANYPEKSMGYLIVKGKMLTLIEQKASTAR
jgi:hypothetical protein